MAMYLKATEREELADLADQYAEHLRNDPEIDDDPERYYDRVIDINLSELEPHLVGPHTPDLDRPISDVARGGEDRGLPGGHLRTRSSARAPTRATRTSGGPRTSRARRRRRACG